MRLLGKSIVAPEMRGREGVYHGPAALMLAPLPSVPALPRTSCYITPRHCKEERPRPPAQHPGDRAGAAEEENNSQVREDLRRLPAPSHSLRAAARRRSGEIMSLFNAPRRKQSTSSLMHIIDWQVLLTSHTCRHIRSIRAGAFILKCDDPFPLQG